MALDWEVDTQLARALRESTAAEDREFWRSIQEARASWRRRCETRERHMFIALGVSAALTAGGLLAALIASLLAALGG
jgi:hypothetical protein